MIQNNSITVGEPLITAPKCRFVLLMSPFFQSVEATLKIHPKKYDIRIWDFMVFYWVLLRIIASTEKTLRPGRFKLDKIQL